MATDGPGAAECQALMDVVVEQQQHVIAAAGPVAEAVWEHGPRPTSDQISACLAGSQDAEVLRQWALTAGASYTVSPTAEASQLVARCWPAIEALAVQIDEHGEISHKHVVKALGLSNDHTRHPFELANIRAGMRAVPDARRC